MKKTAVLITIILLIQTGIYSQTMEVGLFGGGSYYLGDINPGMHFQQIKPAVGVIARYNYDTRWSLRLSAITGKVVGDDAISKKYPKRNLKFKSPITEIASVVEFNFFPYVNGSAYNYFTPYIFCGASYFFFDPRVNGVNARVNGVKLAELQYTDTIVSQNLITSANDTIVNNYYGTENVKYKRHGFAIPFGIGFKYSISQNISLGFEWGMRKTFTDYIDDISTVYPRDASPDDKNKKDIDAFLLSDPTLSHKKDMQRGNPKTMDWFNFVGVSITVEFDIFKKTTCVDFTDGYRK